MAVTVARVHLKMAHAALPALLPTPPEWKMTLRVVLPTPCVAAIPPKQLAKPGRADSDERWDAHKISAGGASSRKNATSPQLKPGRADSVERWDAHKKAAIPDSSSSGTSSLASSSSKRPNSRATSSGRWDVHKKRCPPAPRAELLNDGESSSTGSNDIDMDTEEEEIVWKPRAMYAGPGFAAAAPEPSKLPVPTAFLVRVA